MRSATKGQTVIYKHKLSRYLILSEITVNNNNK